MNRLIRSLAHPHLDWLEPVALLALRFALAIPFWRSGLTKWDSFGRLSDSAVYLFAEEFRLHLGAYSAAYPFPAAMAWAAGTAELLLPVLLVLGLLTRWAAVGLFGMTILIQLTIPSAWATFHLPWAAMALALATFGGGPLALDRLLARPRWVDSRPTAPIPGS
jgi:putative oxidoreductase